jgi:hypothetical protein
VEAEIIYLWPITIIITIFSHLPIISRRLMTKAEACLWKYALKSMHIKVYGFRRQDMF